MLRPLKDSQMKPSIYPICRQRQAAEDSSMKYIYKGVRIAKGRGNVPLPLIKIFSFKEGGYSE